MDQAMVNWAVTAMDFGDDTVRAEQWFKLLAAAYQDPDESEPVGGWDEFVARLNLAADREGFDSAQVEYFVESLRDSASDPIGDVVLPMYEQQDTLPQEYLNLRAAAGGGEQEAQQRRTQSGTGTTRSRCGITWRRRVGPAFQNGLALNYERTEWVAAQPAAVAEESASADQEWRWDESRQVWDHLEGDEWVPQLQNGYALNYDRTEWVPNEAAAPVEEAPPIETPEPTEQPESAELSDEEQAGGSRLGGDGIAGAGEVAPTSWCRSRRGRVAGAGRGRARVRGPAIDAAIKAVDGLELGDLTEDQVDVIFERLLSGVPR